VKVLLKDRGALGDWKVGDANLACCWAAFQSHLMGDPGIAYPVDLAVGSYQEAAVVVSDECDRGGVGSAGLAALDGEEVPTLWPDTKANQAL
jgi:hypothetical protein